MDKDSFRTDLKAKIQYGMENYPRETIDLCARRIANEVNEGNMRNYVKITPKPTGVRLVYYVILYLKTFYF